MEFINLIKIIAFFLVIIGALNWGLFGLFQMDLVAHLFGAGTILAKIIYILVGTSGLILLMHMKDILKL